MLHVTHFWYIHFIKHILLYIYYIQYTSDEATDRPLQTRYDQKMAKYGRVAEQCNLRFVPAVFSHTGQIHGVFRAFIKEQITQKLVAFEGDPKPSKINSIMKWWSRCISVAIAKTASRNVAFKVAKMREAIMEDQDEFLMRNTECADVDMYTNNRAHLEDVGSAKCRFVYCQSSG